LVFLFASLSLSRSLNLIINYRAPMRVWSAVHERARDSATNAALLPFPLPLGPDPDARAPGVDASVVPIVAAADAQVPELVNVCVGKEWYRFPAHFLLPTVRLPSSSSSSSPSPSPSSGQRQMDWTLRFLESDFGGLLPKTYLQQWEWEAMQKQPQQQQQSATATDAQLQARSALFPPESPLHAWFPHLVSRPGTWVLPSHMNDFNRREDGGRSLRPEQCHYIVDLSLPAGEQREPAWEKQQVRLAQPVQLQGRCVAGWEWRVVFSDPFLDSAASPHPLLRAFWLPPYSTRSNVMRPYQLLERVPIFCSSTTGGV
jgi:alpha-1,2-mannosyltransferase